MIVNSILFNNINFMSTYYCQFGDCKITPSYGVIGTKIRLYCFNHKEVDHVNIKNRNCLKCNKQPVFGIINTKIALYCFDHKEIDHVNVKNKTCLECNKRPSYGINNTKIALYCSDHKEIDHVNVITKTCLCCEKHPVFGVRGTKKALYCFNHKEIDHVNVKSKTCLECDNRPSYGIKGTKKALYCVSHKNIDYINVVNKTCLLCDKLPSYGISGTKTRLYCTDHKENEHVLIGRKTCLKCDKIPNFGTKGTKVALYCVQHKEVNHVNVKSKTCEYTNCNTKASFGLLFKTKTHCAKHKNNNEFIKNNPICEFDSCKSHPCYTNENDNYPLRCETHQLEDDKNIIERRCSSCNLTCMLTGNNLCNDCNEFINRQPHKRKETIIKNVLDANKLEYDTYDRIPSEACNKYRPDFVFDKNTYIIILEVDENQHQSYACECEQARMINLFQDFGGLPVVFVRFNPDGYTDNNGKRHQYTKSREIRLLHTLNSLMLYQPKDMLSVVYLYYNEDDGVNKIFKIDYENNRTNEIELIFKDD